MKHEGIVTEQDPIADYEHERSSKAARQEWIERYFNDPISFFEPTNLDELRDIPAGRRLLWFGLSSKSLSVSPSDADLYFDAFPQDLDSLKTYIRTEGTPGNTTEFSMWGISAHRVFETDPKKRGWGSKQSQWIEINDRRILAPSHLLSDNQSQTEKNIGDFGVSSKGYVDAMMDAQSNPVELDHFIEAGNIFSAKEYVALDPAKKTELLRSCLTDLQHALIFDEANNSVFTKERVEEDNARTRKSLQGGHTHYNIAHSMLFGTYQPSAAYNEAQSKFEYEMGNTALRGGGIEEYPFHRILLEVLAEFKRLGKACSSEDVDMLVEFWNKNRNPIFANAVTDALSAIDPERTTTKILELIGATEGEKNALIAILYRIEFKRLGVSSDGVEYLNRMYDLGELNDPNNFVERLTPNGDMGIFNKDQELMKYFNLGDLSDGRRTVRTSVLDFAYDSFFVPRDNETEQERGAREKYIQEFKSQYSDFSKNGVFSHEIKANNFSLKEQGAAMILLHELGDESKDKLVSLAELEGETGLRVFLRFYELDSGIALEALDVLSQNTDPISTHRILEFLESISSYVPRLDEEFEHALEESRSYTQLRTPEPNRVAVKKEVIPEAKRSIISEVHKVLLRIAADDGRDPEALKLYVQGINPKAIVIGTILRATRESFEAADLNEMPFLSLIRYEGGMNSTNDREFVKALRELYKKNYTDKPKLLRRLLDGLDKTRKNLSAEFDVVEVDDKPIAFCAYEFEENHTIHFGKFNVDPDFAGKKLGEQMLEETLDDYAVTNIIKAECDRDTRIACKYLEKGFIAYNEYGLDEITCWDIVRNDHMNKQLATKSLDKEFIMKHIEPGSWINLPVADDPEQAKVYATDAASLENKPLRLLSAGKGYAITRMFREKNLDGGSDIVVIVAEKIDDSIQDFLKPFPLPRVIASRYSIIVT